MACSCCKHVGCDIYEEHHQNPNEYFENYVSLFHQPHYNTKNGYGIKIPHLPA